MKKMSQAGLIGAELLLLGLTIVVALGFGRLFGPGDWARPLVVTAVVVHGVSAVMRRLGVNISVQVLATVVATFYVMALSHAYDTLSYLLPTSETLAVFSEAFDEALALYPEARAPTEPISGFVLLAMVGVAIAALMSDIAAFRLRSEIQALLPQFTLFVFCSLLGSGEYQLRSALSFTLVALIFVALMKAHVNRTPSAWLPADRTRGPNALVRTGGGLALSVGLLAMVITPVLPGVDEEAMWTWRGRSGPGTRMVLSPLVDIRSRMVDQPSTIAFTVQASEPSYWRMMSLDSFDGDIFRMNGSFRPVGNNLGGSGPQTSEVVRQAFTLDSLASPYLPAAFSPIRVDTGQESVRWDDRSSTLLLDRDQPRRGFRYEVESVVANFDPHRLRNAPRTITPSIRERYLDLPELDAEVIELAESIVEDAASPYDQALALQNFLRGFEYSLNVPSGHSGSALTRFLLVDQAGYCEQFSAAFAAMARSVGLPARVAVGFTVGEQSRTRRDTYVVRGEHAHAWPEVWFSGIGWVPFEPTPGRGDPQAAGHTGVEPQQVGPTTTTSTSTTLPGDRQSTTIDPNMLPVFPEPPGGSVTRDDPGFTVPFPVRVAATVALLIGLWIALVAGAVGWSRHRRHRRAGDDPSARLVAAWTDIVAAADRIRLRPQPSETHREFARRLLGRVDHPDPTGLMRLSEKVAAARFSPSVAVDLDRALDVAAATVQTLNDARSRRQRLLDLIDIRRAWPPRSVRSRLLPTVLVERVGS